MSDQQLDQHELQQEENKLIAQRKEKLAAVREARAIAFPNDFRRDAYFADLQKQYADKTKEELEAAAIPVKVAGRIMLNRGSFIVLQDSSERLQVYVNRKTLPEETLAEIKTWDLGDIIGAEGVLARSGKGDLYVDMTSVRLLTKSLRPLPDKHHGLTDTEQRYRQRYVDLMVNEETRHTFRVRSQVIAHIRRFLSERGFLEDHPRRRRGQAVRDPSQRAGHGHVPAHRPGAVPQAPGGRRFREGLRDQPQLP